MKNEYSLCTVHFGEKISNLIEEAFEKYPNMWVNLKGDPNISEFVRVAICYYLDHKFSISFANKQEVKVWVNNKKLRRSHLSWLRNSV